MEAMAEVVTLLDSLELAAALDIAWARWWPLRWLAGGPSESLN